MASWMVHLRLAENLLGEIEGLVPDQDEQVQAMYARPYIYLSQAEMDRFVEHTAQQLEQIYQRLWQEKADTTGIGSALELAWP